MEAHGSHNKVEGERSVQKHLLKTLTEEEHSTDVDIDAVPSDHVRFIICTRCLVVCFDQLRMSLIDMW